MCFDFPLQLLPETFLILRRNERDMIKKMCIRLRVKYLNSCPLLMKLEFLNIFSKNPQISNFVKIRPVEAELFHEDRQTDGRTDRWADMMKSIVAFRNFADAPKHSNLKSYTSSCHSKRDHLQLSQMNVFQQVTAASSLPPQ
jgi:Fe-S-cluster formation regulator IscX/YfhJ